MVSFASRGSTDRKGNRPFTALRRLVAMDHLPTPNQPAIEPIQIPLLENENYDGGDFVGYPARQGYDTRSAQEWEATFQHPSPEFQAFLQRWLYFGTIECTLGHRVDVSQFCVAQGGSSSNDGRLLNSKALEPLLRSWMSEAVEMERADQAGFNKFYTRCGDQFTAAFLVHRNLGRPIHQCREVSAAHSHSHSLMSYIATHKVQDPRDPRIAWSVEALMDLLNGMQRVCAAHRLKARSDTASIPETSMFKRVIREQPHESLATGESQAKLTVELTERRGWCPSDAAVMYNAFSTSIMLYVNSLDMPVDNLTGHGDCTRTHCSRRTLSDSTYERAHAHGCAGCQDSGADQAEIDRILRSGWIPMVRLPDPGAAAERLDRIELGSSEVAVDYIAISHVWSDGLGNVEKNAIPSCQLGRLAGLVRSLPEPFAQKQHIWLDTICVPPDAAGMDEAQGLALERMRDSYEKATAVLVLDRTLYSVPASGKSVLELLIRTFVSPWVRRLWTFQEGCLAPTIFIQFQDRAIDLDKSMDQIMETEDIIVDAVFLPALLDRFKSLRGFFKGNQPQSSKLNAIARSTGFRSTSVATDEALCLAALLGLDMKKIVASEPERRMHTLWGMLSQAPMSLVFSYDDLIPERGLGWAPRALLQQPVTLSDRGIYSHPRLDTQNGRVTPFGLMVAMRGLRFASGPLFIPEQSAILDVRRKVWWHLKLELSEEIAPRRAPHQGHDSSCTCDERGLDVQSLFGADESVVLFSENLIGDLELSSTNLHGYLFAIRKREEPVVMARAKGKDEAAGSAEPVPMVRRICEAQLERIRPGERLNMLEGLLARLGHNGLGYGKCIRRTHEGRMWVQAAAGIMSDGQIWCIE